MILGIGTDLCDVVRISQAIDRHGIRLAQRILVGRELARYEHHVRPANFLAKRFAAKEACAKALGTGFNRGVFMKDMGVINQMSGAPTLKLEGGALKRLEAITPQGHRAVIHLTLTDDHPMAMAVVVIEALPLA